MRWTDISSKMNRKILTTLSALLVVTASVASAQTPLRILRYSPTDTATSGSIISVTFSRPVAGQLDRTIDARRVMTLQPDVKGVYEWRDPITLRFIPDKPLVPGAQHTVSIDTAAIASVGARKGAPFRFTIHVPGASRLGAYSVRGDVRHLGPTPAFRIMYSDAVDLDVVARQSYLEFSAACGGAIPLRVVRQRPIQTGDPSMRHWNTPSDTLGERFMRIVEMEPRDSLKPDCTGSWIVPLFNDDRGRATESHQIQTVPAFRIDSLSGCLRLTRGLERACVPDVVTVWFSAPIDAQLLEKVIHISPTLNKPSLSGQVSAVSFTGRLTPREKYAVSVDTSIRDIFGRKLAGTNEVAAIARDRPPTISHQYNLQTLSREHPAFSIRTVNVDTISMTLRPVPDSLLAQIDGAAGFDYIFHADSSAASTASAIVVNVPVKSVFNTETFVTVVLPDSLRARFTNKVFAVGFAIKAASVAPELVEDQVARRANQLATGAKLPTPQIVQRNFDHLAQMSTLRAHSKVLGSEGPVFVTDSRGNPVANAKIVLLDEARRRLASAVSDGRGLATLIPTSADSLALQKIAPRPNRFGRRTRMLEVTHGTERLIVPIQSTIGNSLGANLTPMSLGSNNSNGDLVHATSFTDRGIYRPGELIYAKAYVRYGIVGSIEVPPPDSVRFTLACYCGGQDDIVRTTVLNEYGAAADSIRIPASQPLSAHGVETEVRINGAWQPICCDAQIQIAEFRAPDFRVTLTADTTRRFVGDTINVLLDARYLFGVPMAGARVQWSAAVDQTWQNDRAIPNTKGYTIGARSWWDPTSPRKYVQLGAEDSLNRNGILNLKIATARNSIDGPTRLNIQVGVSDVNNQTVTASTFVDLRQSSYNVAVKMRSAGWYWRTGTSQTIDAFVATESGERIAGVPLSVSIVRRQWRMDTTTAERNYRWIVDTVQRLQVITTRDSVPIQFVPTVDGAYDVRLEARDPEGRTAATNIGQWAYSNAWAQLGGANPLRLRVASQHAADAQFALGDTARILFESPFEKATAWLTLEREGVVQQLTMPAVKGSNTWTVPITQKFAPNIWAGVVLVARSDSALTSANSADEVLRAGYTEIRVDSTTHALHVEILAEHNQLLPADTARIRVRVQPVVPGNRVTPSEVTLWAVDEGVLSLTDYKTPDILAAIDERLGIPPSFYSTLTELPAADPRFPLRPRLLFRGLNGMAGGVNMLSEVFVEKGGPSLPDDKAAALRSKFRFTAFYVGSAITDSNGVATIHSKLPDNITTFRLMASAVTKGQGYGSTESSLLVTRRVIVRPALPRFVRKGDVLSIGAAVNVRDSSDASLAVRASVDGQMLRGDSVRSISITNAASGRALFSMSVPEHTTADSVAIRFMATDNTVKDGDAVEAKLPIRPAGTPRAHTVIGMLRDSGSVTVNLPGDIDAARSTISVSLGTSPLVAMRTQYARLRDYPYRSTEVIVTGARALLSLSRAERAMGDTVVTGDTAKVRADLQAAVDEITKRHTGEGLFSNWPGARSEDVWFSAYIGSFLRDADEDGLRVSDDLRTRITSQMELMFTQPNWLNDSLKVDQYDRKAWLRVRVTDRLVALRYLRDNGTPNTKAEDEILGLSHLLSWEDNVALANLISERSELLSRANEMLMRAWKGVTIAGKRIDLPDSLRSPLNFPSHIRPAARLLTTTMKLMPDHPMIGALAETIIQQGSVERRWVWNSLDFGSAIEALADFATEQRDSGAARLVARASNGWILFDRNTASASRAKLTVADSTQLLTGLIQSKSRDSASVTMSLRMESNNADARVARRTPLYYSVTVNEVPLQRPVTPDVQGIVVERWYEQFSDGKPITEVKEGDLVRVRLRITVPSDRQYVALEDLLPAGLEVVDLSLRTSAALSPFGTSDAKRHSAMSREDDAGLFAQSSLGGSWDGGWWSPWDYKESRDDRVFYFANELWSGTYSAMYIARATTPGTFVKPPAHAEEMYNRALQGRSDGGVFIVRR
ncbi:MAG: alpha-2-macroglobulin family protein [Gemmatimonadaceae bacterium]